CFSVIYKYLDEAESFNLDNLTTSNDRITKLLQAVATLHNHGVLQQDIHLDNLLIKNEEIYFIDVGSIKSSKNYQNLNKEKSLKNLALLFAQFTFIEQEIFVNALGVYYQARNWLLKNTSCDKTLDKKEQENFANLLSSAWNKRKRNYLSKCFRTCSMTQYKKTFSYEIAFRSNFLDKVDTNFISNIDQYIDKGTIIKAGNSATVAQTTINNKPILIKRYNIKNFTHLLKRFWRPSRAAISWKNANLLEFIGIPTPRPFGFIEKRIGWFRTTAYFITEYIESDELLGVYQQRKPTNYELDQINNIFLSLQHELISHGDFKAQNFLLDETGRINLIDLDAMKEHTSPHKFQMDFIKDKKRFLRNWDDTATKEIFESLLF
ncbi:MAG: lipopolysaccharide core heptose(II) kinase RfaY, partial [Gammaproteobacteria bacterium]